MLIDIKVGRMNSIEKIGSRPDLRLDTSSVLGACMHYFNVFFSVQEIQYRLPILDEFCLTPSPLFL